MVSALQPTWLIGLGRARTRDQPVSRRKGYPGRFRGSPPRSSVNAMSDLIVLSLPCQVVGDVTPTPCAPPSKGRPLAPAEAYPAARGVRRQGVTVNKPTRPDRDPARLTSRRARALRFTLTRHTSSIWFRYPENPSKTAENRTWDLCPLSWFEAPALALKPCVAASQNRYRAGCWP